MRSSTEQPAAQPPTSDQPVLAVSGLRTGLRTDAGVAWPVDGVDLTIRAGETVGLVGESGSGKSLTALSIVGLLPPSGWIEDGAVVFAGEDLRTASARRLTEIRGGGIGFIFQDPMSSLNPTLSVGFQVCEPLRRHRRLSKRQAMNEAAELLGRVGIPAPRERLKDYPHEFSGGMRQRVVIAMALSCHPQLIIADEPTTALDVTIQAQIMELLLESARELSTSLLLITHNLAAAAEVCERVAVMYAGQIVEEGPIGEVFRDPRMPYTQGLLDCLPRQDSADLIPIPGAPPNMWSLPPACRFEPRCSIAHPVCREQQVSLVDLGVPEHRARCLAAEPGGWSA
jgi:oligopeptide/dipeptide ABC transporter ATP-binding protein